MTHLCLFSWGLLTGYVIFFVWMLGMAMRVNVPAFCKRVLCQAFSLSPLEALLVCISSLLLPPGSVIVLALLVREFALGEWSYWINPTTNKPTDV